MFTPELYMMRSTAIPRTRIINATLFPTPKFTSLDVKYPTAIIDIAINAVAEKVVTSVTR